MRGKQIKKKSFCRRIRYGLVSNRNFNKWWIPIYNALWMYLIVKVIIIYSDRSFFHFNDTFPSYVPFVWCAFVGMTMWTRDITRKRKKNDEETDVRFYFHDVPATMSSRVGYQPSWLSSSFFLLFIVSFLFFCLCNFLYFFLLFSCMTNYTSLLLWMAEGRKRARS